MAQPNAQQLLSIQGGAVKMGASDAPFPTGVDFVFDPTQWADLGGLKTGPQLTPTDNITTTSLWNMSDLTTAGDASWALDFGPGEWNYEVIKMHMNFIKTATGSYVPGATNWSGQVVALFYIPNGLLMLHAPNVIVTSRGAMNFGVKNDVAELPMTLGLNTDSRLEGGKPFQWFSTEELVPQAPPVVVP